MSTVPEPDFVKRRIFYVDEAVQKWLIVALVTIEILLLSGALWVLYLQLSGALDANLYRAHFAGKPRIYPPLETALISLAGLAAVNIVALWIADWVWVRHINSILQPLTELTGKIEALDFSEDAPAATGHEVIALTRAWRKTERQRLLCLRAEIARLEVHGDRSFPEADDRARTALEAIISQLPSFVPPPE